MSVIKVQVHGAGTGAVVPCTQDRYGSLAIDTNKVGQGIHL